MRQRNSPGGLNGAHAGGAVLAHARHQDGDGFVAERRRHGMKQHIHRRAMAVDARLIHKNRNVAVLHVTNFHVTIARADQRAPGEQQIAGLRLLHFEGRGFVQPPREHFRKSFRHVLHHQQASRKILGELGEKVLQRVGPAR